MTTRYRRGRVAVIGAGPAGMATALSVHQADHDVLLLERYTQARPAGNTLNLWPPPVKALGLLGVDTTDLGAPCHTEFRSISGHTRVRVNLPDDVIQRYTGGFIGLLRPDLYERLLAALPPGADPYYADVVAGKQEQSLVTVERSPRNPVARLEAPLLHGVDLDHIHDRAEIEPRPWPDDPLAATRGKRRSALV